MGPTPGKIEGVLPNLGLGLRIEVQPRMNVRLDFGHHDMRGLVAKLSHVVTAKIEGGSTKYIFC